jgi:ribonuclease D
LEAILADESIVKAGAGIDQDMLELWECWGRLEARSRLELGGIGSSTKTGNSIIGLQRLTSSIVGVDLRKTKKRALTDWSQVPLTQDQLAYSARDAWAGAAVVAELSRVDPDTFGTAALLDMLKSEQPIQDLYKAAKQRKHAKMQLSTLLHHNVRSPKQSSRKKMPPKVKQKVSKLRRILEQTTRGGPMVFNVEPLGFTIQSKQ